METHSSVFAWRIPGTGEPGGLPSMGSHRVGHDWSDLAAAASVHSWWFFPWVNFCLNMYDVSFFSCFHWCFVGVFDWCQSGDISLESFQLKSVPNWIWFIFYQWLWWNCFPCGSAGKESTYNAGDLGLRPGFETWVGKIPWRRQRLPTPVFWPGEFHGLYRSWCCRVGPDWVTFTLRWN